MSDIKNVKLSFQCPKTKDSLEATSKDAFNCAECNKKVIDFTQKSQEDLEQVLVDKSKTHCGIFIASQMNRNFLKYAAAASVLLGSSGLSTLSAQNVIKTDTVSLVNENHGQMLTGKVIMGFVAPKIEEVISYPEPIGGFDAYSLAISKNLKYPDSLKVEGKVYLILTIGKKGSLKKVEIIGGLDPLADKEAVRAVKATKTKFKPGTKNGEPIESTLAVPIMFKRSKD